VVFFGLHGLVLAAALLLVFGLGLRPRPGAAWRVFGITAGWTAFVGLVNLALGTNFMYLRRKPLAATPLDAMGPWPLYIVTGGVVALVLFQSGAAFWLVESAAFRGAAWAWEIERRQIGSRSSRPLVLHPAQGRQALEARSIPKYGDAAPRSTITKSS
jgi:hypothetical protein